MLRSLGTLIVSAQSGVAIADVGVAYIIGKNIQLDVRAGSPIAGNTPPEPFLERGL